MERIPESLIIDLDGSLCDVSHRVHLAQANKWNEFNDSCDQDLPNEWCLRILTAMHDQSPSLVTFFITGRPERVEGKTEEWLLKYVPAEIITNSHLYMRPNHLEHHHTTLDFKKETYLKTVKDKFDVLFAIDDDKEICGLWRSLGLVCLDCAGWTSKLTLNRR